MWRHQGLFYGLNLPRIKVIQKCHHLDKHRQSFGMIHYLDPLVWSPNMHSSKREMLPKCCHCVLVRCLMLMSGISFSLLDRISSSWITLPKMFIASKKRGMHRRESYFFTFGREFPHCVKRNWQTKVFMAVFLMSVNLNVNFSQLIMTCCRWS